MPPAELGRNSSSARLTLIFANLDAWPPEALATLNCESSPFCSSKSFKSSLDVLQHRQVPFQSTGAKAMTDTTLKKMGCILRMARQIRAKQCRRLTYRTKDIYRHNIEKPSHMWGRREKHTGICNCHQPHVFWLSHRCSIRGSGPCQSMQTTWCADRFTGTEALRITPNSSRGKRRAHQVRREEPIK